MLERGASLNLAALFCGSPGMAGPPFMFSVLRIGRVGRMVPDTAAYFVISYWRDTKHLLDSLGMSLPVTSDSRLCGPMRDPLALYNYDRLVVVASTTPPPRPSWRQDRAPISI